MTTPLRFHAEQDEAPPRLAMAPLVDIVLLLICFYLFVMRSIQSHADPTVALPRMLTDRAVATVPAEVVINLDGVGKLTVNGEAVDLARLDLRLEADRAAALTGGQRLDVVVRADRSLPYAALDEVLAACRAAGIGAVSIRSTREATP